MKELLFSVTRKDLKIEFYSGTGAGGQHRNKHQNCVRIHHPESGAMSTGQSHKERASNIAEAFKSLAGSTPFKMWQARKIEEIRTGKTMEQEIEEAMAAKNLKIEYKEDGGMWVDEGTFSKRA